MTNHKVLSSGDCKYFVKTRSFRHLCQTLQSLKGKKGRFVHVLGSPGTGKSANIYNALARLDLKVYDAFLFIDRDSTPDEVYKTFWDTIEEDMGVKTKKEVYKKAEEYDLVLFADPFLDSEYIDENKVGLGLWTETNGPSTAPFYFRVLREYLVHRKYLKDLNLVTQTAWVLKYKKIRYDILTDFSVFSSFLVFLLKIFFDVVQIKYTKEETIKIIRNHPLAGTDEQIEKYIDEYGCRPRFIFEALERDQ
ncbi:MAG TPA: hypothetical protein VK444_04395 [Methanobacteriaceae archaeon]|nr:hypothetical protein [Methanobacteriaceae archaeon]